MSRLVLRLIAPVALLGVVASAEAQDFDLVATFTNPGASLSSFGSTVAINTHFLVIGDPLRGDAYLYDARDGRLLGKLFEATQQHGGSALTVAATDRRLFVGTPYYNSPTRVGAGRVRLFDGQTATLLETVTDPTPAEFGHFGQYVVAEGDWVVIATGATPREIYSLNTASGVFSKIENIDPSCTSAGAFALEGNSLLIGCRHPSGSFGTALLFDLRDGVLQAEFPNPQRRYSSYGGAVALSERFAFVADSPSLASSVSAPLAKVHVFDRFAGSYIRAITNPEPDATFDAFGTTLATSDDLLFVGADSSDIPVENSGAVFVYDGTTGELLTTIRNPTPAANDRFGRTLVARDDALVVGAVEDQTGAVRPTTTYLYRRLGTCGDGIVAISEQCDDGNLIDGDGCTADCLNEDACGDHDGDGRITTTDALLLLKRAAGQSVPLMCPDPTR